VIETNKGNTNPFNNVSGKDGGARVTSNITRSIEKRRKERLETTKIGGGTKKNKRPRKPNVVKIADTDIRLAKTNTQIPRGKTTRLGRGVAGCRHVEIEGPLEERGGGKVERGRKRG